jgi:hypothetical protein
MSTDTDFRAFQESKGGIPKIRTGCNQEVSNGSSPYAVRLYSGLSLYLTSTGKPPLAPTHPVPGTISMIVYALFLIPGYLRKITLYRILMGGAILVMGFGGVVTHIINIFTQPQWYSSIAAWTASVGINFFGLVLNNITASGKFKK